MEKQKLNDIILKKDDIVYYTFVNKEVRLVITEQFANKTVSAVFGDEIVTKIERPTQYETIYETPKQILDQKEKEYLEAVIRPFKDKEVYIEKFHNDFYGQYIKIQVKNYMDEDESINLPYFEKGTMYKGMELNKEYTLDELGLFE